MPGFGDRLWCPRANVNGPSTAVALVSEPEGERQITVARGLTTVGLVDFKAAAGAVVRLLLDYYWTITGAVVGLTGMAMKTKEFEARVKGKIKGEIRFFRKKGSE